MSIEPRHRERGAMRMGCLVAAGAVVLLVLILGGLLVGRYNNLVSLDERAQAAWSEIDNQYKRRFDLIPQLVATVQGAADFEKSTLEAVTEARASVARVQLPAGVPTDPAKLEAYMQAQQGLGAALSRLFAVVESYPELKANQNFLSLQDQLEGTENRIAVARRDYIDSVQGYNAYLRRFPTNLVAGMFGFDPRAQLEIGEGERERPDVKFDFGKGKG
jgi:LemA protein